MTSAPLFSILFLIAGCIVIPVLLTGISTVALRIATGVLRMDSITLPQAFRVAWITVLVSLALRLPQIVMRANAVLAMMNMGSRGGRFGQPYEMSTYVLNGVGAVDLLVTLCVILFAMLLLRREFRPDDRYDRFDDDAEQPAPPAVKVLPYPDALLLASVHYALTILGMICITVLLTAVFTLLTSV
ncbi:MAG: hypothetical protein KDA58_09525 [Planctomycetaceae bacterium]|nr:hypothetical protein [Planctomycetaceae bacterium]